MGRRSELDRLQEHLEWAYECKVQRLGWSKGRGREARILGRIINLTTHGATIEPDPALLEEVVHELKLEGASPLITPAIKSDHFGDIHGEEIKRRRWRWIGHTLRRPKPCIPREAMQWSPQGERDRKRPRETWQRAVERDRKQFGVG